MKNGKTPQQKVNSIVPSSAPASGSAVPAVPNRYASSDDIAALAYTIYEARGREAGRDLDHWLEAESTLCGTNLADNPVDAPRL